MANGGGKYREYEEKESGVKLMRLVTAEEVQPDTKYYMVDPMNPNIFYETFFDPAVSWDTIMEFVTTKKIYTKNAQPKTKSVPDTRKPPPIPSLWDI